MWLHLQGVKVICGFSTGGVASFPITTLRCPAVNSAPKGVHVRNGTECAPLLVSCHVNARGKRVMLQESHYFLVSGPEMGTPDSA